MKTNLLILTAVMAATLALTGCQQKTGNVDTSKLESSFKTAEPATQSTSQKVVSAIKAGDYATATAELRTLASNAKLTPEQKQAIDDVAAQLKQMFGDAAKKVSDDANKAVGDLQNSLKK